MIIDTQYDLFDVVYIKHDQDCLERMITSIKVLPHASIMYELALGTSASWHFENELTKEVDLVKKLSSK